MVKPLCTSKSVACCVWCQVVYYNCYGSLAIGWALDRRQSFGVRASWNDFGVPVKTNPYFLPWIMRGMYGNPKIRSKFGGDLGSLAARIKTWQPDNRTGKELKYRLEPMLSKL